MGGGHTSDPVDVLDVAFRDAIAAVLGDEHRDEDPVIRTSQNPDFGDYQANGLMGIARKLGSNPRQLACRVAEAAAERLRGVSEPPRVAGPGFVNIRLVPQALRDMLRAMDGPDLGVTPSTDARPIAIDLCGVNIAKQMHVGHLRSTIIGDALARVLERLGRRVHRENHLGDWGLTIAMVISELRAEGADLERLSLGDLDDAYRRAQARCAADETADAAAKETLVDLQRGDAATLRDWRRITEITMRAVYESFDLLQVRLGPPDNRPESFYRDRLAGVVQAFLDAGIAREDQGAIIVSFSDRKRPLLIRKSDGGFLYSTTDLAAVRFRVQELGCSRVIYVVDARQRDHFRDVFDAVRLIGWDRLPDGSRAELVHVPFGSVLGPNRRPLQTRSGENIPLATLLSEAIERGTAEVRTRAADPAAPTHGLSDPQLGAVGKAVGIAAIKYADLSNDLVRDYVFDLDRMISFDGSTGPYLQYAHARVCSIFEKAGVAPPEVAGEAFAVEHPAERRLAILLLRYGQIVHDVAAGLEPHRLCTYLYELAEAYSAFYESCPVLRAEDAPTQRARLRLCGLVQRVLSEGLDLLGIEAPLHM
jgi:arginyl-tRNA synthetase